MNPFWLKLILRAPEDGAGGGSMFNPAAGESGDGQTPPAGDPPPTGTSGEPGAAGADGSRPDWLHEKFEKPEDLATAYTELERKWFTKNDVLKQELRESVDRERMEQLGVPEAADGYEYPEGINPPSETLDGGIREWAHKNGVGKEAFQSLINDVWLPSLPNPEKEIEALGENAQDRIETASAFLSQNVPKELHSVASQVMTTARGVEFVEALMGSKASSGFAPGDDGSAATPMTREAIREMQADPRFGTDEAYTAKVRKAWSDFAARGGK